MRKFIGAVFFMAVGALLMTCAFGLHFVQSPTGFFVIWKSRPSLKDIYVDTRPWKPDEWVKHPDLVQALRRADKSEVVPKPALGNPIKQFFQKFTDDKPRPAGAKTTLR